LPTREQGESRETGEGDGEGYTMNFPLPAGSGDRELLGLNYTLDSPPAKAERISYPNVL